MIMEDFASYKVFKKASCVATCKSMQEAFSKVVNLDNMSGYSIKGVLYDNEKNEVLKDLVVYV